MTEPYNPESGEHNWSNDRPEGTCKGCGAVSTDIQEGLCDMCEHNENGHRMCRGCGVPTPKEGFFGDRCLSCTDERDNRLEEALTEGDQT